jgi:hypothetical protein
MKVLSQGQSEQERNPELADSALSRAGIAVTKARLYNRVQVHLVGARVSPYS